MFEITIKYTGPFGEIKYCTYDAKASDINVAKNKVLKMAAINGQKNATINDTVRIY